MDSMNLSDLLAGAKKNSVEQYSDEALEQKAVELYFVDEPDNNLISDILLEGYKRNNELIKSLVADAVYKGDHGMQENKDLAWTLANEAFAAGLPMGAYVLAQIYIDRKKYEGNADLFLAELLLSVIKDQLPWANDLLTGLQSLKEQGEDMEPVDFMKMNNHQLVDAMNYYTALTWKNDARGYRGVADILTKWPCFQRNLSAMDFYEKGALCPNPDPKCQYKLAHKYTGMKRHKEAFDLYMKAYNGGYKKASVQIAHALWFGIGTSKKRKEAQKFFLEAVKGAYISADYAYRYFFGDASKLYREAEHLYKEEEDTDAAVEKYIKAYDAGNPVAAYKIAKIFCYTTKYQGEGHIPEAKQWMEAFLANDGFDDDKVIKKQDETTPFEYGTYQTLARCYSLEYYMSITKQIDDYSGDCFRKAADYYKKAGYHISAARMMLCDAMLSASSVTRKHKINEAIDYIDKNKFKIGFYEEYYETAIDRIYILFGQDITDENIFGKHKVEQAKTVFSRLQARIKEHGFYYDYLLAGEYYFAIGKVDQALPYFEKGAEGHGDAANYCKMFLGHAKFKDTAYCDELMESSSYNYDIVDRIKAENYLSDSFGWFLYDDESQVNHAMNVHSHKENMDLEIKHSYDTYFYITTLAKLILCYHNRSNGEKIKEANKLLQLAHWSGSIEAASIRNTGHFSNVDLGGSNVMETTNPNMYLVELKRPDPAPTPTSPRNFDKKPAASHSAKTPKPAPRTTRKHFPIVNFILLLLAIVAIVLVRRMDQMSFRSITEEEAVEMAQEIKVTIPDQEVTLLESGETQKLKTGKNVKVLSVYKEKLNKGNSPRVYWTNQKYLIELPDGTRAYGPLMETAIGQLIVLPEGDTAVITAVKKAKKNPTVQATGAESRFEYAYTLEDHKEPYALEDLHIYFPQRVAYLAQGLREEDFTVGQDTLAENKKDFQKVKKFFLYDIRPITKKVGFFVFPKYQVWNEFYLQRWFRNLMVFVAYVIELLLIFIWIPRFIRKLKK
jgi:TPR repeat protein